MSGRAVLQLALGDLADVPATSRWARSGNVRLHVLDYGGDGVPLVVLPGITSPAIAMDFVARALTDLVRPLVVDVRGRGLSDSGPSYTLDTYADDTTAVIRDLTLHEPLLLGHSMGARVAAVTAARGVPLSGTVLVDPPMSGPGRGPYPTTLDTFLEQLAQASRGTTADEVAHSWPRWPRREQELRARWLSSCDVDAVAATHHGFETEDFFATWPRVPAPTVLIRGETSPVVTPSQAAEAADANPAARLDTVADAGHMVFWDQPDAALGTLRAHLRDLLERGTAHAGSRSRTGLA
jgi:N-formylmaleamate deformylase